MPQISLTPELHSLLSDYLNDFVTLRSHTDYSGSLSLIEEYEALNPGEGNDFFEKYGVGNVVIGINRPLERSQAYERLLYLLHEYDSEHYLKIHKGTPYYFIGWTAFQFFDFDRSLFYMDAAVSEDLRLFDPKQRQLETPAISFFLLKDQQRLTGIFQHIQLAMVISTVLTEFNRQSEIQLSKDDFVQGFVKPTLYGDKKQRSVLTALYSFFLQFESKKDQIRLRSSEGGSIEPFLNHLFDGARILESILELSGGRGNNLQAKVESLPNLRVDSAKFRGNRSLESAENTVLQLQCEGANYQDINFAASYVIRNTTSHSLLWPDQFKNEDSYSMLYYCLAGSILWSIFTLWTDGDAVS